MLIQPNRVGLASWVSDARSTRKALMSLTSLMSACSGGVCMARRTRAPCSNQTRCFDHLTAITSTATLYKLPHICQPAQQQCGCAGVQGHIPVSTPLLPCAPTACCGGGLAWLSLEAMAELQPQRAAALASAVRWLLSWPLPGPCGRSRAPFMMHMSMQCLPPCHRACNHGRHSLR
jgi:hypothetical protein